MPKSKGFKNPAHLKLRIENSKQTLIYYQRANFSAITSTPSDIILLPVQDSKILSFLSKALGVRAVVEKTRELWKKENTVFHLDKVKNAGNIFEIEVWSSSKTATKDKIKFGEYKKKLLLLLDKIIKGSNEDLVLKAKKRAKTK
ncbi:MAG: CYTH domain-containing protein [Candidatus Pacebacteria bacterium]|nr:CYTH domain-containing protein [Candidatus Paceibacterota bacterium]